MYITSNRPVSPSHSHPPEPGGKENFENLMEKALTKGREITVPEGIAVIVFAHKSVDAWESMLNAVINSGWTIVASWPITK